MKLKDILTEATARKKLYSHFVNTIHESYVKYPLHDDMLYTVLMVIDFIHVIFGDPTVK